MSDTPQISFAPGSIDVRWVEEQTASNLHLWATRRKTGVKNDKDGNPVDQYEKGYLAIMVQNSGPPEYLPDQAGKVLAQVFDVDRLTAAYMAVAEVAQAKGASLLRPSKENLLQGQVDAQAKELSEMKAAIAALTAAKPEPKGKSKE